MPAPGDVAPARFSVEIRDRVIDGIYARITALVSVCAVGLDRVHLLTIQGYLALVFSALIALLLGVALTGVAIWL